MYTPYVADAQEASIDASWADSLIERLAGSPIDDYESTMPMARRLFRHYRQQNDTCHMAQAAVAMGSCYDALGKLDSSLYILLQADRWNDKGCDPELPFRIALNLSSVYLSLREYDRVDSVCAQALEGRINGDRSKHHADLLFNRAVARAEQGDLEGADARFKELEELARANDDAGNEIDALLNRGALHGMMKDAPGARRFLSTALRRCDEVDCPMRATILLNLGALAKDDGRYMEAFALADSARTSAKEHGDLFLQMHAVGMKAESAHLSGDHARSWELAQEHLALRDSLLDAEKVRAVSDVREKYQTEKRLRQIKELEVEKLDAKLREAQLQRTRNIYLFSGIAVVVLAGGLWNRLRFVDRSRRAIQHEKDISEGLLHNILPEEVADELKVKGEAEARLIDHVTVLFTDFKGFTALSEVLTPKELVKDLHECFSAFDRICEEHGLEKIKTIGDAYMAAGGLPVTNTTHAMDAIHAALAMRDFIAAGKARKIAAGLPYFEIRIGLHTGPVVAGIVGVKKFSYDIWGDTVNTASRMESSGEPGKVNISAATHDLVKEAPDLAFTPRGKVQAKGKGVMEMYFVEERTT
ncbi:MAG TPA: adenylate/guanylate cyclase domain-containing protein [Flavobacteriales bacterium]|nr:adenylate/guanylate cyclase domain-containing protein [Flavobacteriales bacterium]